MKTKRSRPFIEGKNDVKLFIRLTPNSSSDEIFAIDEGPRGPHFKARVRAQPEKGKANTALLKLVSKWLDIPKSTASITSGSKMRLKTVVLHQPDDLTIDLLKKYTDTHSRRISKIPHP